MTIVSLIIFFFALLGIVVQVVSKLLHPEIPHGITTILVVVLFIGAIQLLSISVLGQYIGRIFEEVKQRPKYIIKCIYRHQSNKNGPHIQS